MSYRGVKMVVLVSDEGLVISYFVNLVPHLSIAVTRNGLLVDTDFLMSNDNSLVDPVVIICVEYRLNKLPKRACTRIELEK